MINIITLLLIYMCLCGRIITSYDDECPRNLTAATLENRNCRTYCADKSCLSNYADCLCDGHCGKSCINKAYSCLVPKQILHGQFKLSSNRREFNSRVTYSCDDGYILIGPKERICQGDQQWSGKDPFCTVLGVQCEVSPFEIENGYAILGNRKQFYVYETVEYKCDVNFKPSLPAITKTQCQLPSDATSNGFWTPDIQLSCIEKRCSLPWRIDNGRHEIENDDYGIAIHNDMKSNFTIGTEIRYVCDPGYMLRGRKYSVCLEDQTWSSYAPVCEVVECKNEVDNILHGTFFKSGTVYNSYVTYKCDQGYHLVGEEHRWCSDTGEWDGIAPTCKEIDCGEPTPPRKGYVQTPYGTKWDDIITYACNEGATTINEFALTATCIVEDNKPRWSMPPPDCYASCVYRRNQFQNGYLVMYDKDTNSTELLGSQSTVSHDKNFRLVCNEGFYIRLEMKEWSDEIYCADGRWTGPKRCVPDQDAGSVTTNLFEPDQESNSGSDDYDISSESVIKPPVDVFCSVRKPDYLLANGSTNVRNRRFSSGSVVKFRCTDIVQFKFLGESILMCENGYWNGTSPSCVRLHEREYGTYPMIKYTVSDGESSIDDDGSLIISEGANLMLHCSWFKTNGQPDWVDLRFTENVIPPAWNTAKNEYSIKILNIQKNDAIKYTCKVMGKANSFYLKIVSREYYSTTVNLAYTTVEDHPLKEFCVKRNDNNIAVYRYQYIHGIETMGSVVHGTKMTVTCRSGYEILPTTNYNVNIVGISRCDDGRWNPDIRCEPARCMCSKIPAHDLAEKFMLTKDCSISKDHGTYIFLDCMEGYQTSQELQIECKYGNWDLRKIQYRSCVRGINNSTCKLDLSDQPNVIAFVDGNIYTNHTTHNANLHFKENTILKIRCTNPLEYKLDPPVNNIICRRGSWRLPRCQQVTLFHNPLQIRIVTYTKPNYNRFEYQYTDDGKIILPQNIEIGVFCSMTQYYKPTLKIEEFTSSYKKLTIRKSFMSDGEYAHISPVSEKLAGKITCSSMNPYIRISHAQEFIFSDTCSPIDEVYLRNHRLQIVPGNRQSVYVEGDQIPIQCLSNPSIKYSTLCRPETDQQWQLNVSIPQIIC